MNAPTMVTSRNPIRDILAKFRREFYAAGVFSAVSNLLMITPTLYMLQVFDRVMTSGSGFTLIAVSLITLFLFFMMAVAESARAQMLVRAGVRFDTLLNTQIFRASFQASLKRSGRDPAESFADLTNLRQFLSTNGVFAFFDAPWSPIYIGVCWLLHPLLGLTCLVFSVMLVVVAFVSHRLTKKLNEAALESGMKTSGFVQAKLKNAEAIESMGMMSGLFSRWLGLHNEHVDILTRSQDITQRVQAFGRFLQYAQQTLIMAVGAVLVVDGLLTPAEMIATNFLMQRALAPVQLIVASWKGAVTAKLSYDRLGQLLQEEGGAPGAHPVDAPIEGRLSLQQLVAMAPGREEPILKGLSAEIEPGEIIAIIGPSGSGKTTLARSLLGIWPYRQGKVLLDGVSIDAWDRTQLGPHLGYLPQDIELFDGTIAENIGRLGKVDSELVIAAARAAGVHEMILRFPAGYDTPMGVAGNLLSAGQRQRIALARALYGEPSLLVLDEPNANLDDAGEAALLQAIQRFKAMGKTIIAVSHRGGIVGLADRILILNQGRIQAFGPRDELLKPSTVVAAQA